MWILLAWLSQVRVSSLSFVEDEDEDISGSKGQDVVVEAVPFSTHYGKFIVECLLIDDAGLLFDILA